jgi:hypothetical protein
MFVTNIVRVCDGIRLAVALGWQGNAKEAHKPAAFKAIVEKLWLLLLCCCYCCCCCCRRDGVYALAEGYNQDILSADVLQYLQSHKKDSRKPFFLYFAPNAVHT